MSSVKSSVKSTLGIEQEDHSKRNMIIIIVIIVILFLLLAGGCGGVGHVIASSSSKGGKNGSSGCTTTSSKSTIPKGKLVNIAPGAKATQSSGTTGALAIDGKKDILTPTGGQCSSTAGTEAFPWLCIEFDKMSVVKEVVIWSPSIESRYDQLHIRVGNFPECIGKGAKPLYHNSICNGFQPGTNLLGASSNYTFSCIGGKGILVGQYVNGVLGFYNTRCEMLEYTSTVHRQQKAAPRKLRSITCGQIETGEVANVLLPVAALKTTIHGFTIELDKPTIIFNVKLWRTKATRDGNNKKQLIIYDNLEIRVGNINEVALIKAKSSEFYRNGVCTAVVGEPVWGADEI
uniref:Fucolectin tachylectin-4 pentraxin-1 domain-containing protein n=1 Tax=Strigamia maritima TaxID=126957 RepID=T1J9G3_STRMM